MLGRKGWGGGGGGRGVLAREDLSRTCERQIPLSDAWSTFCVQHRPQRSGGKDYLVLISLQPKGIVNILSHFTGQTRAVMGHRNRFWTESKLTRL